MPSARVSRATQKPTKRINMTVHSLCAMRQHLCEQLVSISTREDGKVFNNAPLTRADIPKMVEAVKN